MKNSILFTMCFFMSYLVLCQSNLSLKIRHDLEEKAIDIYKSLGIKVLNIENSYNIDSLFLFIDNKGNKLEGFRFYINGNHVSYYMLLVYKDKYFISKSNDIDSDMHKMCLFLNGIDIETNFKQAICNILISIYNDNKRVSKDAVIIDD